MSSSLTGAKPLIRLAIPFCCTKLHQYGICGSLWHWISSFLLGRFQCVQFRGASSRWVLVESGVPQGLFWVRFCLIFFVLDLPSFVQSPLPQYADDTLLYRPIHSEEDTNIIQNDLNNIVNWCNTNKMALSSDKCKVMRLSGRINVVRPAPSYTIHGKSLSVVQNYKYLGIMISFNLKWGGGDHVKLIFSRASRLLDSIRRWSVAMILKFLLIFTLLYAVPFLSIGSLHGCHIKLATLNLWKKYKEPGAFVSKFFYGKYDVDPFEYISLNSRHKNTLKFCHTYARTESFNYNVLIDFLRILISFLKIFVITFFFFFSISG